MASGQNRDQSLTIGLLNNMPRKAMRSTEQQIAGLLASASGQTSVRLRSFRLDIGPRPTDEDASHETLADLLASRLDGLIVTGAKPTAAAIEHETAWTGLARVVEWAQDRTVSTIWSCLAAQAAVRRLDGVPRQALPAKLSGVFACQAACEHPLVAALPQRWSVPHSRLNDIAEAALRESGYTILSHGPETGADVFTKQVGGSAFVFMQGHPEYAPDALYREYRRDVMQFIRGERSTHPAMPEAYFDADAACALAALRDQVIAAPRVAHLLLMDAAIARPFGHAWHQPAVQLYASWLALIADRRAEPRAPR